MGSRAGEKESVSDRLGPVPAELQAWAKRASVVTSVRRDERKKSRSKTPLDDRRGRRRSLSKEKRKSVSPGRMKDKSDSRKDRRRERKSQSPSRRESPVKKARRNQQ